MGRPGARRSPPLHLEHWPTTHSPRKKLIIPKWPPQWSEPEETALQWNDEEMARKQCTAGNSLTACPCGSRNQAFSQLNLQSRDLEGMGVPSQLTGKVRLFYPQEAGLLNTLTMTCFQLLNPRAALCLAGLIAAPMQSLWICTRAHIHTHPGLVRCSEAHILNPIAAQDQALAVATVSLLE